MKIRMGLGGTMIGCASSPGSQTHCVDLCQLEPHPSAGAVFHSSHFEVSEALGKGRFEVSDISAGVDRCGVYVDDGLEPPLTCQDFV